MIQGLKAQAAKDAAAAATAPPIVNASVKQLDDLARCVRRSPRPSCRRKRAKAILRSRRSGRCDTLPRLVKMDPAFPRDRADPNRIRMMEIHFSGAGSPYDAMMRQAAETFDWGAIEALMRRAPSGLPPRPPQEAESKSAASIAARVTSHKICLRIRCRGQPSEARSVIARQNSRKRILNRRRVSRAATNAGTLTCRPARSDAREGEA